MTTIWKKISTAVLVVFFAFCCLSITGGLYFHVRGGEWLKNFIESQTNLSVEVGKTKTNFLTRFSFLDVSVKGGIQAEIPRIDVKFRPWYFLQRKPRFGSFFKVFVNEPSFQTAYPVSPILKTSDQKKDGSSFAVPFTISILSGDIKVDYKNRPYSLSQIEADFQYGFSDTFLAWEGVSPQFGRLEGQAQFLPQESGGQIVSGDVERFDVRAFQLLLPEQEILKRFSGMINVEFVKDDSQSEPWSVTVRDNNLKVAVLADKPKERVRLKASLSNKRLEANASVAESVQIHGQVQNPFRGAELDFHVEGKDDSFVRAFDFLGVSTRTSLVDGDFDFAFDVSGSTVSPTVEGEFLIHAHKGFVRVPPIEGKARVEKGETFINARLAKGEVAIRSPHWSNPSRQTNIRVTNLSLEDIGAVNGWKNVAGEFSSDLFLQTHERPVNIKGDFGLGQFKWGRTARDKKIEGTLSFVDGDLVLETINNILGIDLTLGNQKTIVRKASLKLGPDSEVVARGFIDPDDQRVRVSIKGAQIAPDFWPPLVQQYPDIEGQLDFEGTLSSLKGDLDGEFDVVFSGLRFVPWGEVWNGSTDVVFDETSFSLSKILVDGGYAGEVKRTQRGQRPLWDINVSFDDSNPALLADIFKSSFPVKGKITGNADIEIARRRLIGVSSVTWHGGQIQDFHFDRFALVSQMTPESINVEEMVLLKGKRSLLAQGQFIPTSTGWDYKAGVQSHDWKLRLFDFDGEFDLEGDFSLRRKKFRGDVTSPLAWINDYPLENLTIVFHQDAFRRVANGKADNDISFDFSQNRKNGQVTGAIEADGLDVSTMSTKFLPAFGFRALAQGKGDLKGTLKGTLNDPRLSFEANLKDTVWRKEKFDSKVFLNVQNTKINLVSSRTKFENGGTAFVKGMFYPRKKGRMEIEGVASGVPLNSAFNMLVWPVTWEGKADATFSVNGNQQDGLQTEIVLDGEHEGIGPFPGGGNITGIVTGDNGAWNLENLRVQSGNGYMRLAKGSEIFVDRDAAGHLRIVSDVRNLQTGLLTFFGGIELSGSWQRPDQANLEVVPPKEIDVFARSLWINQYLLNGNVTHLTIKPDELDFSPISGSGQQLSGVLKYEDYPEIEVEDFRFSENGEEKFYLDGFVGSPNWDYRLRTQSVDAAVVRALFDTTLPFSGPMDIRLEATGNLDEPVIQSNVTWRKGSLGSIPVDLATAKVFLKEGIVDIKKIVARKKNGYLLRGAMKVGTTLTEKGLAQEPQIDLKLEKGDLEVLEAIFPEVSRAKGSFDGLLSLSGNGADRKFSGYLNAQDIKLHSSSYIPYLKKGRFALRFDENELTVSGRGKMNRGTLDLNGDVSFYEGEPAWYNIELRTLGEKGVSVRVPDLAIPPGPVLGRFSILKKKLSGISRGDPYINLSLTGPSQHPTVSGSVILENTIFTFPGAEEKGVPGNPNAVQRWITDFQNSLIWDVSISAGKKTRYENSLVDAKIEGDLRVFGPTTNISVEGQIESQQGAIVYSGNEFKINDALIEIRTERPTIDQVDSQQILIYLKANAEKEVFYTDGLGDRNQDTIIMEVDRAVLGEIKPRFRSKNNSAISSQRALQLALGIPVSQTVDENEFLADQAQASSQEDFDRVLRTGLVQLLDSSLASPLAKAIARQTGLVDFIRVTYQDEDTLEDGPVSDVENLDDTEGEGEESNLVRYIKGTQVRMGRELSNRLFADYSFRFDEFENQLDFRHEVELAYRVHRNFFLRAIGELDSERTLGRPPDRRALLENRWRFGLPRRKKSGNAPDSVPSPSTALPPAREQ